MKKLFILLFLFSCVTENEIVPEKKSSDRILSKPKILTVFLGQSNAGYYTRLDLNYKRVELPCWNVRTTKLDSYTSPDQCINRLTGPMLFYAELLLQDTATISPYFFQYHYAGSDLYTKWNPTNPLGLYVKATYQLDSAVKVIKPDLINVVWIQGESDATKYNKSLAYNANEQAFLNALNSRYKINKFVNYNIVMGWGYPSIINAAKQNRGIQLSVDKSFYNTDNLHMSIDGCRQFARQLYEIAR